MGNMIRASTSSVVTALSSAAAMVILVLATRSGQLDSVAAFGAGMASTAIAAAVFGAGTSLSFANGSLDVKSAVLAVRFKFVLPMLIVCAILTAFAYSIAGPLGFLPLVCGGLSVAANNLAEIEVSYLRSHLRTLEILFVNVVSRGVGVTIAIYGVYHVAMVVMAFTYLLLLTVISRRDGGFPKVSRDRLVDAMRMAVKRSFLGATMLESLNARLPFLVGATALLVTAAPELPSLLSVQQGIMAVIISVIFTTMTFRSGTGERPRWMRFIEVLTVISGFAISVLLAAFAEIILSVMGLGVESGTLFSWYLLVAALPLAVWNRKMQYFEYSLREGPAFIARLCFVMAGVVPCCVGAVVSGNPLLVAGAWFVGEAFGLGFSYAMYVKRSFRLRSA